MNDQINVSDETKVEDVTTNNKSWFNGVHTFSSVKINPPQEQPNKLFINVSETVITTDKVG